MYFSTTFAALLTMSSTLVAVQGVPTDDKYSYDKECPSNQFYYQERDCCLPNGGPDKYYPVPSGKRCPNDYYWYHEKECCVPKYEKYVAPKCPEKFVWTDSCCEESYQGEKFDGKDKYDGDNDDTYDDGKYDDDKDEDESYTGKYDDKDGDDQKWSGDNY